MAIKAGDHVKITYEPFTYLGPWKMVGLSPRHPYCAVIENDVGEIRTIHLDFIEETKPLKRAQLSGYAVMLTDLGGNPRVEYWKYSPAILTEVQRVGLQIIGWLNLDVTVEEGMRG